MPNIYYLQNNTGYKENENVNTVANIKLLFKL